MPEREQSERRIAAGAAMGDHLALARRERPRDRAGGSPERGEAALAWTLALSVGGSVLAIGAVHAPVLLALSALVLAAAAQGILLRRRAAGAAVWPALIPLLLAGYTVLQAVPMPMAWLERIAPVHADVWARALLPLGEGPPRLASVSLDPGASLIEAVKWACYAGAFFAAAEVAARRGAAWGAAVVFGSALAAALTTLAHGLFGATRVFGLYAPQFAVSPWHVGPLLNPNNLSGYLNLGAFCGVGLYVSRRPLLPRWAVGLGVATIMAIGLTSASRGGLGALSIGAIVLAALLWRRDLRGAAPGALKSLVAVALGGGLLLALLGSSSLTWTELSDRDLSKIELLRSTLPMLRDHLWLGVGRGAFESTYPVYRAAPGNVVFTHAESFPLQWGCEWGLPVAAAALGAFGWVLRPGPLGVRRSAVAAAAWTGILVLLAQNLVDLALEIPAVSIAAVTVLGSLWGDRRRRGMPSRRGGGVEERARGLLASPAVRACAVAGAGAALLAAAASWGWHDVASDRAAVRAAQEASAAGSDGGAALRRALREAMGRHPGEPYFSLVGALAAWRSQAANPMPWLQRSLERSQRNGRAHFLLAEVLAARGARRQALLELRLAAQDDPELVPSVARLARRWTRDHDELALAVPAGEPGAALLGALALRLTDPGDEELRLRCAREAVARDPGALRSRWALGDALLVAVAQDRPPGACGGEARAACGREIEAQARAIEAADRGSNLALELRARWLLQDGRAAQAEELLSAACNRVADRPPCLRLRVEAAAQAGSDVRLASAVKSLLGEACGAPAPCAAAATWLGDVMAGRKWWGAAVTHYERAIAAEPSEERWQKLADAATAAGSYVRAVEALEKVLRGRGGRDEALQRRIDDLRARAAGRLLAP